MEWLTSILTGGATGLLGVGLGVFADWLKKKQDNRHELEMRRLDIKTIEIETASAERVAEVRAQAESDQADAVTLSASYAADAASYSSGQVSPLFVFVDVVRGMIRPFLTLYLAAVVTWMSAEALDMQGGLEGLDPRFTADLVEDLVATVLYVFTTSVLWWFGSRNLYNRNRDHARVEK